ncbi:helicase C-terminal domain-containing protein [Vagococcus intermedius]|uniref:3'-5' exonuclease DinG n=1 Tax=Vagococcus intermedius TaxID=2991418 RepID=A0AAF0CTA7_9ENTE|nr:helicase C-terminal domain-containing protein [Vagococcus intermedius]WEG72609.1 exonuclease domain-containing protein [Vagococcus intermedius]WEG74694.1 exonuclease domain-containing protein [Vagococcus intermedius]
MQKDQTYAVVDLETTGTNPKTDRIIQIGCVFVKNNQIISRFATDINPKQTITKHITSLTGITNEQVTEAPYFEDKAEEIYDLLKECVFVAHNIYFDYQFLSHELVRCGQQHLTIEGIDTVELAQIFLPKSPSFRLGDLAEQYGFSHDRPHQADSDAEVTAELLILIEQKIVTLPLVTIEKIVELAGPCGMDTANYLKMLARAMQEKIAPLATDIQIIQGIALKKQLTTLSNLLITDAEVCQDDYPETKKEKEQLYQDFLNYRSNQGKMMNLVHRFFTTEVSQGEAQDNFERKNLAIEAPTGSGKTFGYLLPLSYLATPTNPVIISTVSVLLENQLIEQAIPLVNKIRPGSLMATLVKSHRHFIDLERFSSTLRSPSQQKQYALYQMRVLVWLTETETGDLDELNLISLNHPFFKEVRHRGLAYLSKSSPYYKVDFWRYLQQKMAQSNVIVVNHAFLCHENDRDEFILPSSDFLLIDEAHHLPDIAQKASSFKLTSYELAKKIAYLANEELGSVVETPAWLESNCAKTEKSLRYVLTELSHVIEELKEDVIEGLLIDRGYKTEEEVMITDSMLHELPVYTAAHSNQLILLLLEATQLAKELEKSYLAALDRWTISEKRMITYWLDELTALPQFYQFVKNFIEKEETGIVRWLVISEKSHQLTAYYSDFSQSVVGNSRWYPRYKKIIYTGGTIAVGKDSQFLGRALGIDYLPVKSVPASYDYSQQARLYIPKEVGEIRELGSQEHIEFISQTIRELSEQQNRSLLVLFTSHDMLAKVYHEINQPLMSEGVEVLAQGLSGSREKITKRFTHLKQGVLLGTDSFWEGVDLPGDSLEMIIVTRLPFDSPDRPFIKEKYQYLQSQGIDSFYKYALPKAILRLRQGFGRLIRSEEDKGVMLVLDYRLIQAKYGSRFIKALPANLPLIEENLSTICQDIKEFL